MKKLLSLLLAGSMLFSLAACGDEAKDKDEDKKNNTEAVENVVANNGDEVDIGGENDSADEGGVKVGEYITFGTYEQDNNTSNGKEPIEWLVLDEQDGKVLVISKYALDAQPFNEEMIDVTWETCTLRSWLNGEFMNETFTSSEKAKIPTVTAPAEGSERYDTDAGNDTQDKVFVLGFWEAYSYLMNIGKACGATDYAVAQGVTVKEETDNCYWWLRTPGMYQYYFTMISDDGLGNSSGTKVANRSIGVRPAMWIEL